MASYKIDITDYVIIIFGGTGELGGQLALHLNSLGANVIIVGRDGNKANKLLQHMNYKALYMHFDGLKQDPEIVFDTVIKRYGKLDVLINACGMNSPTPFADITEEEMTNIFKVNYILPTKCCQLAIKQMKIQHFGSIINFGSISALTPLSKVYTYSASKAALHNLTKNLAREFSIYGMSINTVVPGFFPAEQNKNILDPDRVKAIMSHTPVKRFGTPSDLFGICTLLSHHESSRFITGSEFVVDGGFNATKI